VDKQMQTEIKARDPEHWQSAIGVDGRDAQISSQCRSFLQA
jgi:hypothetical protein